MKRIIAFLSAIVIMFSIPVCAVESSSFVNGTMTLMDFLWSAGMRALTGSGEMPQLTEFMSSMLCSYFDSDYCADSDDHEHDWRAAAGVARCNNCGLFGSFTVDDFRTAYGGFTDSLDTTEASGYPGWSGYIGLTASNKRYFNLTSDLKTLEFPFFYFLRQCGIAEKIMVVGGSSSSLLGFYFDSDGILYVGLFKNPAGSFNAVYCTMYDFGSLELVENYLCSSYTGGYRIFYSESAAKAYSEFLSTECAYFDWERQGYFFHSTAQYYFYAYCFTKGSSDAVFSSTSEEINPRYGYDGTSSSGSFARLRYYNLLDSFTMDELFVIEQPTNTTHDSRCASLTAALEEYNANHVIQSGDTTINYYIMPTGGDDFYSPALYDEEELVYTDPVTGIQYLTSGWTYDYLTRCYTLDMADETFLIDETVIDTIKLTYGDELLTVEHYAADELIQTDSYNYVMMSGSECGLNGHSYTYEEVKTATCTSTGERKYTCSVCGDEYAEAVPMNAHAYTHSVLKEPTCIDSGIYVYTCSTCGNQVTESVAALGHDWQPTAITDTTYSLPDGTSCPECSGTNYTFTRDGVIYSCTCSDCAAEWSEEAEVTYGSTTYTCTRCEETKVEQDEEEGSQKNWFNKLVFKFSFLTSIGKIYRQLVADITSDAATAAAVADGEIMLADVTSEHAATDGSTTYTAPELAISFGDSDIYGVDWANIKPLDLSWYAPHKETVDGILSGILWLSYLFLLIKQAPGIIRGGVMVTQDRENIYEWHMRK